MPEDKNKSGLSYTEYQYLLPVTQGYTKRYLRNIETDLCRYYQEEANKATKRHEDRKAGEFLAMREGVKKLLKVVHDKVKNFTGERKQ